MAGPCKRIRERYRKAEATDNRKKQHTRKRRRKKKAESVLHSNAGTIYQSTVSSQAELSSTKGANPAANGLRFLRSEPVPSFQTKIDVAVDLADSDPDVLPNSQPAVKEAVFVEKYCYIRNLSEYVPI